MSNLKRYLFYFAQELLEFRHPEMESLSKLFDINVELPKTEIKPFWIISGISEKEAKLLSSRSVLLKFCAEIWSSGKSLSQFHENLRKFEYEEKYKKTSFKFRIESYNKKLLQKEKIGRIESINYLAFEGPINLKDPEHEFVYLEYWGLDPNLSPKMEEPDEIFMGRIISDGFRDHVKTISLKTRKFIGNTSMDPLMSLLMANQAKCAPNQLMFDPFCGTGSLLIAAAKYGSYVMGADIDYLTLHARTRPSRINQKIREKDESVAANMDQYSLSHLYLDIFVGDFANCPLIDTLKFDSIICDPPYGIREAMSKLERKERKQPTKSSVDGVHIPSLSAYKIKHLYDDLLNFSVKHLVMGGRLVCFFPCLKEAYDESLLPQHSALELVANSEQDLQADTSRRLLTYEKISEVGELIENEKLADVDFREQFFTQLDRSHKAKVERKEQWKQHNIEQLAKRGISYKAYDKDQKKLKDSK